MPPQSRVARHPSCRAGGLQGQLSREARAVLPERTAGGSTAPAVDGAGILPHRAGAWNPARVRPTGVLHKAKEVFPGPSSASARLL